MTNEIWVIVIIANIQIIISVGIGYWQVKTAKEIANPAKKREKPRRNIIGKRLKYHLLITIPFCIFVPIHLIIIFIFVSKLDSPYSQFMIPLSMSLIVFQTLFSFAYSILEHLISALGPILKCIDLRLDKIPKDPCTTDECPFVK